MASVITGAFPTGEKKLSLKGTISYTSFQITLTDLDFFTSFPWILNITIPAISLCNGVSSLKHVQFYFKLQMGLPSGNITMTIQYTNAQVTYTVHISHKIKPLKTDKTKKNKPARKVT
jgi:hypothetical protein